MPTPSYGITLIRATPSYGNSLIWQLQAFIKKTGQRFDLVMITEMFDESLVLLKRLLGVPIEEVYAGQFKEGNRKTVPTSHQEKMIEEVSAVDREIYKHFASKLEEKWHAAKKDGGEGQLEQLQKLAKKVDPACRKKTSSCSAALRTSGDPPHGYMEHLHARGLDH